MDGHSSYRKTFFKIDVAELSDTATVTMWDQVTAAVRPAVNETAFCSASRHWLLSFFVLFFGRGRGEERVQEEFSGLWNTAAERWEDCDGRHGLKCTSGQVSTSPRWPSSLISAAWRAPERVGRRDGMSTGRKVRVVCPVCVESSATPPVTDGTALASLKKGQRPWKIPFQQFSDLCWTPTTSLCRIHHLKRHTCMLHIATISAQFFQPYTIKVVLSTWRAKDEVQDLQKQSQNIVSHSFTASLQTLASCWNWCFDDDMFLQ